jgi:hypothetical protein
VLGVDAAALHGISEASAFSERSALVVLVGESLGHSHGVGHGFDDVLVVGVGQVVENPYSLSRTDTRDSLDRCQQQGLVGSPRRDERGDVRPGGVHLPALIAEWGITTVTEMMLVDLAVLNYYHTLRVQGWIGDLALHIEHEFFGQEALAENGQRRGRRQGRFSVEEDVRRLSEQLMPLLDRANRMLIRNLQAINR